MILSKLFIYYQQVTHNFGDIEPTVWERWLFGEEDKPQGSQ